MIAQVIWLLNASKKNSMFWHLFKRWSTKYTQTLIIGYTFFGKFFKEFLKKQLIQHQMITCYTPKQNKKIGQDNWTIVECVQNMVHHKNMPFNFWVNATHCAICILDRINTKTLNEKTLFEAWTGTKPFVAHMNFFGSVCYVHVPKGLCGKLDKNKLERFMVYFDESKSCQIWNSMQWRIMVNGHVMVDERMN